MSGRHGLAELRVLLRMDWWLVLLAGVLLLWGLLFIHSATAADPQFRGQELRQLVFLGVSCALGLVLVSVPYARVMRSAWLFYGLILLALLALPFLGPRINGAVRWYRLGPLSLQPAEFAKLVVIVVLAAWLRFRHKARATEGLLVPILITAVPAVLIMQQPDLASSLVFWPILLAMCYAAGVSKKSLLAVVAIGLALLLVGKLYFLHDYQDQRVEVWAQHFTWEAGIENTNTDQGREVREQLLGPAFQPWQSLIAVGSGGLSGFGYRLGPQSQFDFLPYRNADYIFAVVCEELGLVGALGLLLLQALLVFWLLRIAARTRERFGRLLVIGVAAYLGTQTLLHVAVCTWLLPATGLQMPLISYGGSGTMVAILALALALNVSARREPVLAADGYA
ncbi:MAG: FtsW/RodA/SpoVE family cell cycle protein [Planctomycetota bacterium]